MAELAVYASVILNIAAVALLISLLRSKSAGDGENRTISYIEKSRIQSESALREEMGRIRDEIGKSSRSGREEQRDSLKQFGDTVMSLLNGIRESVEGRLKAIQEDNNAKLEKMRLTVDEKLHDTLEQKLGRSFKQVSDQLDRVHAGIGEMRTLAASVGDLNRTLTNVKSRGVWGEVALESLLEQIFTPEQYAKNVATKPNSAERVEFAVKLPEGPDGGPLLLPIDAKFPLEDYHRLEQAREKGDMEASNEAAKALENTIKAEAKKIRDKYINPPYSTDFAILFLPSESLYAEVLRRPGLFDYAQRECRVMIAGPTTLAALLNSLQMGFKTLAIQKRTSEVWNILGLVKTEFGKFGDSLARTKKKLEEASGGIEDVEKRARVLSGKLAKAEELPVPGSGGENGDGGAV
ncbi:MAG: DNA recombination protein RmuC [Nitrospinae bacterium]|nr:DNA recombination protein RmuC [Nitrospinota bacterium]